MATVEGSQEAKVFEFLHANGIEHSGSEIAEAVGCSKAVANRAKAKYMETLEKGELKEVEIKDLKLDKGTQMRPALDEASVKDYMEFFDDLPPVKARATRHGLILTEGFHRVEAANRLGRTTIKAMVKDGTLKEAVWDAVGANTDHGLKRDRETKRRAVLTALETPEGRKMAKDSKNELRKHLGVSWGFVEKILAEVEGRDAKGQSARKSETPRDEPNEAAEPETSETSTDEPEDVQDAKAEGVVPADADVEVTEVVGDEDEDDAEDGPQDAPEAPRAASKAPMTDDEYLAECPAYGALTGSARTAFRKAALDYRKWEPLLKGIKQEVGSLGNKGSMSPVEWALYTVVTILHPKDWLICKACNGTCKTAEGEPCPTCRHRGFLHHH